MNFVSVRLITDDIRRLVAFYEAVTGLPAAWATENFAELEMPSCTLAIASTRTLALFGSDVARPAANSTAILEFRVHVVDADYRRLEATATIVQKPTTMPWGNRSLLCRDPDGTLVNLFTPATAAAVERYAAKDRERSR